MAFINQNGDLLLNFGMPVKTFDTEMQFDYWSSKLKDPVEDLKKFIIIKNYQGAENYKPVELLINNESYTLYQELEVNYFTVESDTPMSITPKWGVTGTMEYSIDNSATWHSIARGAATPEATKIMLRGTMSQNGLYLPTSTDNEWRITTGSNVKVSGDITTLINPLGKVTTLDPSAFAYMLSESTSIVDASRLRLPASAPDYCCTYMFNGCSQLVTGPQLPATTVGQFAYDHMFFDCIKLTSAPSLPAKTLGTSCYSFMFSGCTLLAETPTLPATILSDDCYYGMFKSCKTITTAPELPATDLRINCYYVMFMGCSKLVIAPDLPAQILPRGCYYGMLSQCPRLNGIPRLPGSLDQGSAAVMFGNGADLFSRTQDATHTLIIRNNSASSIVQFSKLGNFLASQTLYAVPKP